MPGGVSIHFRAEAGSGGLMVAFERIKLDPLRVVSIPVDPLHCPSEDQTVWRLRLSFVAAMGRR